MTEVAWKPTDLKWLLTRGASQGVIDAAGRIQRMRTTLEEMRSESAPPIPWLASRSSQLAVFYRLLANFYSDREFLVDRNNVEYWGAEL